MRQLIECTLDRRAQFQTGWYSMHHCQAVWITRQRAGRADMWVGRGSAPARRVGNWDPIKGTYSPHPTVVPLQGKDLHRGIPILNIKITTMAEAEEIHRDTLYYVLPTTDFFSQSPIRLNEQRLRFERAAVSVLFIASNVQLSDAPCTHRLPRYLYFQLCDIGTLNFVSLDSPSFFS